MTQADRFVSTLLPYLLARASHLVSAEFYDHLQRRGISVRRWRLMAVLWDSDGLTINEISQAILVEQSSTTRLVDRAVGDGLVSKSQFAPDKRKVVVRITKAGKRYIEDLIVDAAHADERIAENFEGSEIAELKSVLLSLIDRMENRSAEQHLNDAKDSPMANAD